MATCHHMNMAHIFDRMCVLFAVILISNFESVLSNPMMMNESICNLTEITNKGINSSDDCKIIGEEGGEELWRILMDRSQLVMTVIG